MLIEAIKKLEAAGFVASYTMNSVKFAKSGGETEAEINADAPIKSWANSSVLRALSGVGKRGESLGFTQSEPTPFTKGQLDRVRLRVAALNPVTYKVN